MNSVPNKQYIKKSEEPVEEPIKMINYNIVRFLGGSTLNGITYKEVEPSNKDTQH